MQRTPIYVDRVTMLDTPFVATNHLVPGPLSYPNPGTAERVISSAWGAVVGFNPPTSNAWFKQRVVLKSRWNIYSTGDGLADGDEVNIHGTDPTRADSDGDGQDDGSELAAGTNPLQNGSYFRVTAVAKTAHGFLL